MKIKIPLFRAMVLALFWVIAVFPGQAAAAPAAPGYVHAKGISSTEIVVNWKSVVGVDGYYIYRSATETGTYEKIGQVTGAATTVFQDNDADYITTGIQPISASAEYYYKVSAYDSTGESVLSDLTVHTYTSPDGQTVSKILSKGRTNPPQAPAGVTLTDNNNMTVTVKWTAGKEPNIIGYNIYRSETGGGTPVKLNTTLLTGTEYTDSVLFNNYYYYSITAVDDKNFEGQKSPEKTIKPVGQETTNVPHVKFQQDAKECAYCHSTHSASGQDLVTKVSESETCYVCHDGTGSRNNVYQDFNETYPSKHPLGQNGISCASCHDAHLDSKAVESTGSRLYPAILRPVSVDGNMVYKGNEQCYKCHGVGSTLKGGDHETAFESSGHNAMSATPDSGTDIKCSLCHQPHAGPKSNLKALGEENSCFKCHNEDGLATGSADIFSRALSGEGNGTRHDILAADRQQSGAQLQCVNCHNPHGATATNKLTDPDAPAPGNLWSGTKIDFCIKCHDGAFPTSTQTHPYAPGVSSGTKTVKDIKEAYYLGTDTYADKHGEGDGQPNSLDLAMGYSNDPAAPNYMFECNVCHEPHGTINNFGLRTQMTSVDGTKTKTGLVSYSWVYQEGTTAVTGVDSRFFCSSCHGPSSHIESQSFPTNCNTCHKHGGGL